MYSDDLYAMFDWKVYLEDSVKEHRTNLNLAIQDYFVKRGQLVRDREGILYRVDSCRDFYNFENMEEVNRYHHRLVPVEGFGQYVYRVQSELTVVE